MAEQRLHTLRRKLATDEASLSTGKGSTAARANLGRSAVAATKCAGVLGLVHVAAVWPMTAAAEQAMSTSLGTPLFAAPPAFVALLWATTKRRRGLPMRQNATENIL
jgi:hypothetical protein